MDDAWFQLIGILLWPISIVLRALVSSAFAQRQLRDTVRRLLAQEPVLWSGHWPWPAPESYALLCDPESAKRDAFKIGLLQLIAMRILIPEYIQESEHKNQWETILRRGPTSSQRVNGSVAAIYRLWESSSKPRTVGQVTQQAKQKYGSLASFAEREVMPSLSHTELHTRQGEMESRMADVLHHMQQQRGCWIDREPRQALMAAVVAVAAERPTPLEEKEVQLITQQSERVGGVATVPQENNTHGDSWPIWLDWLILHNFERTFAVVDSVHGVGCGDGSDGSDSGNGGDSVDCCDIGS